MDDNLKKAIETSADMCAYFCRCLVSNGIPYRRAVPMAMKLLELVLNDAKKQG